MIEPVEFATPRSGQPLLKIMIEPVEFATQTSFVSHC
jgi:hypothetical protein